MKDRYENLKANKGYVWWKDFNKYMTLQHMENNYWIDRLVNSLIKSVVDINKQKEFLIKKCERFKYINYNIQNPTVLKIC